VEAALVPLVVAALVPLVVAGEVAVVAGAEPDAEEDAPVAAAVVADPVGRSLNVTPTAAQSCSAAAIAASRSSPLQLDSMQVAVLVTKVELLQRQVLSVAEQPPRSAFAIHVPAQAGMLWRPRRVEAEAEAAARATVMRAKRIMKVCRVKFNEGVQQSAFCVRKWKLKGELSWALD
jgi:hypothetical protein